MRRRVTFSRNFTLSLSRTCRCYCKYCAFATHQPHLYAPEEVERAARRAARRERAKELLVLTGERPEVNAGGRRRGSRSYGHEDFTSYVVWTCERALERGLLPHTNLGVLGAGELSNAQGGDRLPGPDARVDQSGPGRPSGLADQASRPAARDDRGRRRAEDPVHARDPGRDRGVARRTGWRRSRRWPSCTSATATSRR